MMPERDLDPGKIRVLTMVEGIDTLGGGAERLAREIAEGLDPQRFDSTFCVTRWEPRPGYQEILDGLREAGVGFLALQRGSRLDLRPWRILVRHLKDTGTDVLHSHMHGSNFWGAMIAPRAGTPVFVAHEHTWSYEGNAARVALDRYLISRRADAFVACSRDDRRKMIEIEKIPAERTRFIPNGISWPEREDPVSRSEARSRLSLEPDQPVIGLVATLRPQKNVDLLIDATAILAERFPRLAVLIAGPGDAERLQALAQKRGVAERIEFLGLRNDIPDVLAGCDIGVLCSDFEGSPLSVMEYMEAGLPVVATTVGGVPDIVDDGVTGILVPPRAPGALADGIARLLKDRDLAKRMGLAGRERRRTEFDISGTVRAVEALYEELLTASSPRREVAGVET